MNRRLITSALLYSNGDLHLGHLAGAYLPADIYARFSRLMNIDTLFISGSDEYGVAITLSAEQAQRSPKEQVDHYHERNQTILNKLDISFDNFSRTTWKGHDHFVIDYFNDLKKNGFLFKINRSTFSVTENRFLSDRYVVGECPKCGYEDARGDECTQCGAMYEAVELVNPRSKINGSALQRKKNGTLVFRSTEVQK